MRSAIPPYYLMAPNTHRSPEQLSRAYGFKYPQEMAESLPMDALVADFGAGKSKLGRAITDLRPDVRWCNVDLRTGLFRFAQRQQRRSAPGLQYIKADVFAAPFQAETLDRVYSSWLLPHICLDSEELALTAVRNMAILLKSDGQMSFNSSDRRGAALTVSAAEYQESPDDVALRIVQASTLPPDEAGVHVLNNALRYGLWLHKLP